jgi:hypothetical protein
MAAANSLAASDEEKRRAMLLGELDGEAGVGHSWDWASIGTVWSPANEKAALAMLSSVLRESLPSLASREPQDGEDKVWCYSRLGARVDRTFKLPLALRIGPNNKTAMNRNAQLLNRYNVSHVEHVTEYSQ